MSEIQTSSLHVPSEEAGWVSFVWLIYLVPFLLFPALAGGGARVWWATAAGSVAFLALYFWGYRVAGRRILWPIAGIALLAAVLAPVNPWSSTLWVFAAAFVGLSGRPAVAARWLVLLLAAIGIESWLLRLPVWYWAPAIVFSALIGGVKIHYTEIRRADVRLRLAHEEVERLAQTAERERIGRDLHDLLGHTLTLIALKAELAGKLAPRDPAAALREIAEVERISREALAEVRTAVSGYRSADLAAELVRARLTLVAAGVDPEISTSSLALPPLPAETASALALALREAITNVVRHAGASTCSVRLAAQGGSVVLEVEDDGRGGGPREGSGLLGMRERIAALGGGVERRSSGGTRLSVTLPLAEARPADAAAAAGGSAASPTLVLRPEAG